MILGIIYNMPSYPEALKQKGLKARHRPEMHAKAGDLKAKALDLCYT